MECREEEENGGGGSARGGAGGNRCRGAAVYTRPTARDIGRRTARMGREVADLGGAAAANSDPKW